MISKLLSHTLALVVGAALVFGGLQVIQWYYPSPTGTLLNAPRKPTIAPQSKIVKGVGSEVVQPKIVALKPNKTQVKKIEKKLGAPLPAGKLLSVNEIKELCNGGTVVVSLEPVVNGGNETIPSSENPLTTVVTVYPNKRPFFQWKLERSVGLYYGLGAGALTGSIWNAEFEQSLFRIGPAIASVKAGTFVGAFGHFEYVAAGAKVTF